MFVVKLPHELANICQRFRSNSLTNLMLIQDSRASNVLKQLARIRKAEFDGFREPPDVWDMREGLRARAVTVPSDEVLCLFCNMKMDMELVTGLPVVERMPKFWSSIKKVPVGLVFSATKRKLTQSGLRWAPQSFMGELDSPHWYIQQSFGPRVDGFPTVAGLQIQIPAYLCSPELLLFDHSFDTFFSNRQMAFQDEKGCWWSICLSRNFNHERKLHLDPPW